MAVFHSVDHLYNRSMGRPYDQEALARQVANGERRGVDDDELDDTYSLDGSDLFIASPLERLGAVGRELDKLRDKCVDGPIYVQDIDFHAIQEAQDVSASFHSTYAEMAKEDEKFACAIQDWTISELLVRHPEFATEQKKSSPSELHEQLLETASVVEMLIAQLVEDGEDPRLIHLAENWYGELLADCMVAEFKHYYALAA